MYTVIEDTAMGKCLYYRCPKRLGSMVCIDLPIHNGQCTFINSVGDLIKSEPRMS